MDGGYISGKSSRISKLRRNNPEMDSTLIRYLQSRSPVSGLGGDIFSSPDNKRQYNHSGSSSGSSFGTSRLMSPLSAVENIESPPVYCTAVKLEEEVVVMDGILVQSTPGGRSGSRSAMDSGSSGKSLYKTEICRSWEESGNCRYGLKCQFAHGKEELRSTQNLVKNKAEANLCKSHTSTGSSSNPKNRIIQQGLTAAATKGATAANASPPPKPVSVSSESTIASSINNMDWSLYDDNIEISSIPSTNKAPCREDIDGYINGVLYGPTTKKRLPVFTKISPE